MLLIILSLAHLVMADDTTVLRAPQAGRAVYERYLKQTQNFSYSETAARQIENATPDTSAMDRCLEAIAFSPQEKSSLCFSSLQSLKQQLWTPPLRRVLIPFLERLMGENIEHKKLYREIHMGLKKPFAKKFSGDLDLAVREHRIFEHWLARQPEWQDAKIYINGVSLKESEPLDAKAIVQWFVISNAGRNVSFIGTRSSFQKYLNEAEDLRFLDCQSISPSAFDLSSFGRAEYFFSPSCVPNLKKEKIIATESVYSRWQKQQSGFQTTAKLETPSTLPKWAIPVLLGVIVGANALKGKKVSVRMPEF